MKRALILFTILLLISSVYPAPINGKLQTYYQPDNTALEVVITGDDYYVNTRTSDGYEIIRDVDNVWKYAKLDAAHRFTPTEIPAHHPAPSFLTKNLSESTVVIQEKITSMQKLLGIDSNGCFINFPKPTRGYGYTGRRVALALLVKFPDLEHEATVTRDDLDDFCNAPDYTGYGNATSAYGYFHIQSGGKMTYNNIVTAYFTAKYSRSYYSSLAFREGAKRLITEGMTALTEQGFDFSQCDANNDGDIDGVNLFYAGVCPNSFAQGLWPHKSTHSFSGLVDSGLSSSFIYQITAIGPAPFIGLFCHESAHMLCNFPDLYTHPSYGSQDNFGNFGLMGNFSEVNHPPNLCAFLKLQAGWAEAIELTSTSNQRGLVEMSGNVFYRFRNSSKSNEYFLIEARGRTGYENSGFGGAQNPTFPSEGIVVYHCNESGNNYTPSIRPNGSNFTTPYKALVLEATPNTIASPWYTSPRPAMGDGFTSSNGALSSSSTPALNFWASDGRTVASDLVLDNFSPLQELMTFTVGSTTLSNAPQLEVLGSSIELKAFASATQIKTNLILFNSQNGTVNYQITPADSWMTANKLSGTFTTEATETIELTFDLSGLSPGLHNSSVTVNDTNTDREITLPIVLEIKDKAIISTSLQTISETLPSGDFINLTMDISNTGESQLDYKVISTVDWLKVDNATETIYNEINQIDFTIDAQALLPGNYSTTLIIENINDSDGDKAIPVSLLVTGTNKYVLASPNYTSIIYKNSYHEIIWNSEQNSVNHVRIDLINDNFIQTLVKRAAAAGTYNWRVPGSIPTGSGYKIRISNLENTELFDESNLPFTIQDSANIITPPYNESFEANFGNFQQPADDNFDWIRKSGSTPTSGTGPSSASSGSYYLFIEGTWQFDMTAKLGLAVDLRDYISCSFYFNYHMYDMYNKYMGDLIFQVSTDNKTWINLWTMSGSQGNSWRSATIDLSDYCGTTIYTRFKGKTGFGPFSDIAIDNIQITGTESSFVNRDIGLVSEQTGKLLNWLVQDESDITAYQVINRATGELLHTVTPGDRQYFRSVQNVYYLELSTSETVSIIVVFDDNWEREFQPTDSDNVSHTYQLITGWNLIAFPGSNPDLSQFSGVYWVWDGSSYIIENDPQVNQGIWYYSETDQTISVTATRNYKDIELNRGWNLIGPVQNIHQPAESLLNYRWDGTMYQQLQVEDKLEKGNGYWLFKL